MYTRRAPAMLGQDTTTIDLTASNGASGTTTFFGPSDTSSTTDTTTAPAATPPAPAASTSDTGGFLTSLFSGIAQVAGAAAPVVSAVQGGSTLTTAQQIQFAALNAQRVAQGLTPLSAQAYLQTVTPTIGQRFTSAIKAAPSSTLLIGGLAAVGLVFMLAKK